MAEVVEADESFQETADVSPSFARTCRHVIDGPNRRACGEADSFIQALSGRTEVFELGVKQIREMGPAAFAKLIERHEKMAELAKAEAAKPKATDDGTSCTLDFDRDYAGQAKRLASWVDAVGGAKYCTASKLFWYTDLDQAKAVAEKEKKPILSLRMLGNLTDELSCANSRFFRTTLYSNAEISKLLREKYVLHWKSVRPVPKITIDFGDGRKVERTITGNSIHYVMLADGTIIDALPGLYGPQAFRERISNLAALADLVQATPADDRDSFLVSYHQASEQAIQIAWRADLAKLGVNVEAPRAHAAQNQLQAQQVGLPKAAIAGRVAITKSIIEIPTLRAIAKVEEDSLSRSNDQLEQATTEELWTKIAALHAAESKLDSASRALIVSHNPTAIVAGKRARTKNDVESPLVVMLRTLEQSAALDTVKNEYQLHRRLHRWLADGTAPREIEALNERVYAELFLTPSSDPWLGLAPEDAYAALPENGVSKPTVQE